MAKNTPRQKRSIDDLRRASLAVQYELMSLYRCHELLQSSHVGWSSTDKEKAVSNTFLHSMLLAARNLLSFLYSYGPRDTDMIAEDFFNDPGDWRQRRVVPSPEMANGDLIGQISKRLAHLTWGRADRTKPLWGAFQIVWNVGLALQSFVTLADEAKIHEQLRSDVGGMMTLLRGVLDEHPEFNGAMAPTLDSISFDDLDYFDRENGEAEGAED